MPKMGQAEVSERLAQLLAELSEGSVHCVILAAAANDEKRAVAFGLETNTSDPIAMALLQAGLQKLHGAQPADPPLHAALLM